ncbi:hypothetical protein DXV75_11810 [Alteromonas aestuariivivens]|uniref:Uncharacterized protein n=1 Tax=Alteromonas aestuariivivens TaxID=1938339 RepID=A0A3D8M4Z2_9ALTE|nr:ETEC_3214 domain-containing protein [Alteromonas aestuariivivens]RDV24759.1 hypothetical protein DXV75_11810 [Alteromonas aestuariivivens]
MAKFTHKQQYEDLTLLSIGRTTDFVEGIFGPPQVIKPSTSNPEVVFQYYHTGKALLTIFNHNQRVAGFVVIPLVRDFYPSIHYINRTLGQQTVAELIPAQQDFYSDTNNLLYYAEANTLGKEYLFIQLAVGFVEYGMNELVWQGARVPATDVIKSLQRINQHYLSENTDALMLELEKFRSSTPPNFFALTELDGRLVADSLLTRVEFQSYFGNVHD